MASEWKLREYARKCYIKIKGYTLEKAAKLYPYYYPKILYYYLQFKNADMEKALFAIRAPSYVADRNESYLLVLKEKEKIQRAQLKLQELTIFQPAINEAMLQGYPVESIEKIIHKWQSEQLRVFKEIVQDQSDSLKNLTAIKDFTNKYGLFAITNMIKPIMEGAEELNSLLKHNINTLESLNGRD